MTIQSISTASVPHIASWISTTQKYHAPRHSRLLRHQTVRLYVAYFVTVFKHGG